MAIHVQCSNCKAEYDVPEERAGHRGRCRCGYLMDIPADGPTGEVRASGATRAEAPRFSPPPAEPAPARPQAAPVAQVESQERGRVAPPTAAPSGPVSRTAVFRPLASIVFPDKCVGCFSEAPTRPLTLGTYAATKANTGASIGGFGGGLVGALIGGAIGSAVSARAGETSSYQIPICERCFAQLDKKKIRELANGNNLKATSNQFLSREIRKGCIVLKFSNDDYARDFWSGNSGRVFATVEECRSAQSGAP